MKDVWLHVFSFLNARIQYIHVAWVCDTWRTWVHEGAAGTLLQGVQHVDLQLSLGPRHTRSVLRRLAQHASTQECRLALHVTIDDVASCAPPVDWLPTCWTSYACVGRLEVYFPKDYHCAPSQVPAWLLHVVGCLWPTELLVRGAPYVITALVSALSEKARAGLDTVCLVVQGTFDCEQRTGASAMRDVLRMLRGCRALRRLVMPSLSPGAWMSLIPGPELQVPTVRDVCVNHGGAPAVPWLFPYAERLTVWTPLCQGQLEGRRHVCGFTVPRVTVTEALKELFCARPLSLWVGATSGLTTLALCILPVQLASLEGLAACTMLHTLCLVVLEKLEAGWPPGWGNLLGVQGAREVVGTTCPRYGRSSACHLSPAPHPVPLHLACPLPALRHLGCCYHSGRVHVSAETYGHDVHTLVVCQYEGPLPQREAWPRCTRFAVHNYSPRTSLRHTGQQ